MTGPSAIRDIRGAEVCCSGPDGAPHDPRRLDVPAEAIVACPVCGTRYRRTPGWNRLSAAHWPKSERRRDPPE